MQNSTLSDIKGIIETKNNILIVSHYSPDGDAIGSSLALSDFLDSIGKKSFIYNRDQIPNYLDFLDYKNFYNTTEAFPQDFDLLILLDLNAFERTGEDMESYINSNFVNDKKSIVVIDHHENPTINNANLHIDTDAASTGILVYRLIKKFNKKINSKIATSLLTTIITDTSSFKNSNSNTESFMVSAELMEIGAELDLINSRIFANEEIKKLQLKTKIFSTLKFEQEIRTAICFSTTMFYEETNTTKDHSAGIANSLISYSNVEIGIFIREIEQNKWKTSLRTNNYCDLASFANKFGGGGHKNAAGFTFNGELELLIKKIISELKHG